ncbi:MAG: START domain-containing protein [Pseudomonadales bacterium]|nr:START domain-containing protein [Pseudomonadales bacterium]
MPSFAQNVLRSISTMLAIFLSCTAVASDWQLEADEDAIKLYTRQADNSPMKAYKVETRVRASLSSLVAFLNDEKFFPQWMDKVVEVEKLREISDKETLIYQVIDAPWPEKDQDNILYTKWVQDPDTLAVTKKIVAEPMYMNAHKDRRRQKFYEAEWQLTPLDNGVIKVVYTAEIDPGVGDVKPWMEQMLAYQMPFNTLRNFRKANFDRYSANKFAFIQEPKRSALVMAE